MYARKNRTLSAMSAFSAIVAVYEGFARKTHYPTNSENQVSDDIVLPVCHMVDSSTLSVLAQNALFAMLCIAELSDLWQNASSVIRHKTWNFSECTTWI